MPAIRLTSPEFCAFEEACYKLRQIDREFELDDPEFEVLISIDGRKRTRRSRRWVYPVFVHAPSKASLELRIKELNIPNVVDILIKEP